MWAGLQTAGDKLIDFHWLPILYFYIEIIQITYKLMQNFLVHTLLLVL